MTHATTQQIIEAFNKLTLEQLKGLRLAGDRFSEATGFDGGRDLLQEAIWRMLDGRRKWPRHIRFDFYVYRVMDSIAHGDRKRIQAEGWLVSPFDEHCDEALVWRCPRPTPEQAALAAEELRLAARATARVRLSLRSELDRAVLDRLLDGDTPAEIRAALRLAPREYELARQRVMARLRAVGVAEGFEPVAAAKPKGARKAAASDAGLPPSTAPAPRPASRSPSRRPR
ncbi:hypothetical protein [Burkholderia gladioli]|uniref:hypothetical protein n=1 Tax=Burkholderia gladioli TaxID=28095 RepID=UPI0016421D00|nr:hypothetical protein [Burkholderia gladioli]